MDNFNTMNFMYFANNYSNKQLKECLNSEHLYNKFLSLADDLNSGTQAFFKLFMQLDNTNKNNVLDYISKNYNYKG